MDIRKIKKLIELVEESGISELEISEGEESVRISRALAPRVFRQLNNIFPSKRNNLRWLALLRLLRLYQKRSAADRLQSTATLFVLQW